MRISRKRARKPLKIRTKNRTNTGVNTRYDMFPETLPVNSGYLANKGSDLLWFAHNNSHAAGGRPSRYLTVQRRLP